MFVSMSVNLYVCVCRDGCSVFLLLVAPSLLPVVVGCLRYWWVMGGQSDFLLAATGLQVEVEQETAWFPSLSHGNDIGVLVAATLVFDHVECGPVS